MIIYDVEIKNCIQSRNEERNPNFQYCNGWDDYVGMDFACAVVFDYQFDRYDLYDEFMLDELRETFAKAECIVGYNILKFDNNLLNACEIPIPSNRCYDLLRAIASAAGTPNDFKGLSLDAVCKANFTIAKSGDGANAPKLYQRKLFGELFNYCMRDVWLTKRLTDKIIRTGRIINPRTGREIVVKKPGA